MAARGRLPVLRQLLVDANLLAFHGDITARREISHDAAHHLARATDAGGDILLSQAFRNNRFAALPDGLLFHEPNESAVDILECEERSARPRFAGHSDLPLIRVTRELPSV